MMHRGILNLLFALHFIHLAFNVSVFGLDLEKCTKRSLGMESGEIKDNQITASSSFDSQSLGPQNSRIRTEINSGAWCSKAQIKNGTYEFLQISFNSTFVIRAIETQGRYGNGTGKEFTTAYLIDYWRSGVSKWIRYKDRNGANLITGNVDTINAVLNNLDPPLIASKIRIIPHSIETRTACLRVEIYGCEYKDGLLSYSMSAFPSSSTSQEDFTDDTFEQTDDLDPVYKTTKGLGLLTDGIIPKHPPVDPLYHLPFRNSTWAAWSKNETSGNVEVRFDFDHQRHFSEVEIHEFGSPIDTIEVEFSTDGLVFGHSVVKRFPQELVGQRSEQKHYTIKIPLNQNAQFVKICFKFYTEWLYLSEIRFGTDTDEGSSILQDFALNQSDYGLYYVLVAVLSVLFILLSTGLCVLISMRRKTGPKSEKSLISSLGSPSSRSTAATSLSREIKNGTLIATLPHNGYPRHVIHSNSFAPTFHQGILSQHKGNLYVATEQRSPSQRLLGVTPTSRSCSGTLFNSMNRDQPPSLLDINFPPPPSSSTTSTTRADGNTGPSNSSSEGIYAEPCSTAPLLPNYHNSRHRNSNHSRRPIAKPRSRDSLTRKNRTLPSRSRPSVDDEPHYAVAHISSDSNATSPRPQHHHFNFHDTQALQLEPLLHPQTLQSHQRFIRKSNNMQLVEKIGEGKFTHIYSCRLRDDKTGENKWAALKRLYIDNEAARLALIAEAHYMNDLQHINICRFMGQCEDLSIVTELAINSDLRTYCLKEGKKLSLSQMLSFCAEIALGMSYLEERGVIHGHLSPKCCLLNDQNQVKLSSARGPNHHAQLRYSAPEAIVLNVWSSRSDAYSFGMTVFEILNYCTQQPYQSLTNAELINNARNQLECSSDAIYPEFPIDSSVDKEMAELLRECWSYPTELRPGFKEMQIFMSRKLLSNKP